MSAGDHSSIDGIPDTCREEFNQLLGEPLKQEAALRNAVEGYRNLISKAKGLDDELGEQLAVTSLTLLDGWDGASDDHKHLIQAGICYFVQDDDAGGDLASIAGFDDDQLVMNAVVRHLGRQDLVI